MSTKQLIDLLISAAYCSSFKDRREWLILSSLVLHSVSWADLVFQNFHCFITYCIMWCKCCSYLFCFDFYLHGHIESNHGEYEERERVKAIAVQLTSGIVQFCNFHFPAFICGCIILHIRILHSTWRITLIVIAVQQLFFPAQWQVHQILESSGEFYQPVQENLILKLIWEHVKLQAAAEWNSNSSTFLAKCCTFHSATFTVLLIKLRL